MAVCTKPNKELKMKAKKIFLILNIHFLEDILFYFSLETRMSSDKMEWE